MNKKYGFQNQGVNFVWISKLNIPQSLINAQAEKKSPKTKLTVSNNKHAQGGI